MPKAASSSPRQLSLPYARTAASAMDHAASETALKIVFPRDEASRSSYRTKDGKQLSPYRWSVLELAAAIPCGRVTTYGRLAEGLGSNARAVGSALRNNPFAPFVPCHRIIAADGFIGGFHGQWGGQPLGEKQRQKLKMLTEEGVSFDSKAILRNTSQFWTPPKA